MSLLIAFQNLFSKKKKKKNCFFSKGSSFAAIWIFIIKKNILICYVNSCLHGIILIKINTISNHMLC